MDSASNKEFKLNQLKLEHYYFFTGDLAKGMPIKTSIELKQKYDYEKNSLIWEQTVSHTYFDLDDYQKETTSTYTAVTDGEVIKEIEKYDLRNLKNNYFTDEKPDNFSHWEINYNNYFKICGTYKQVIKEFTENSEILNFGDIMNIEIKKVKDIINKV